MKLLEEELKRLLRKLRNDRFTSLESINYILLFNNNGVYWKQLAPFGDETGCKELYRRVIYNQIEEIGEAYWNEQWYEFPQINSYYPDPTPGVFIDEEMAKEIMILNVG